MHMKLTFRLRRDSKPSKHDPAVNQGAKATEHNGMWRGRYRQNLLCQADASKVQSQAG